MKGYHKRRSTSNRMLYSIMYKCEHPYYSYCTLFKDGEFGLAVIQKRFNSKLKVSFWDVTDSWLANDIYEEKKFMEVFAKLSAPASEDGLYPTIEVRKLMYLLGMKPLKLPGWEKFS